MSGVRITHFEYCPGKPDYIIALGDNGRLYQGQAWNYDCRNFWTPMQALPCVDGVTTGSDGAREPLAETDRAKITALVRRLLGGYKSGEITEWTATAAVVNTVAVALGGNIEDLRRWLEKDMS